MGVVEWRYVSIITHYSNSPLLHLLLILSFNVGNAYSDECNANGFCRLLRN